MRRAGRHRHLRRIRDYQHPGAELRLDALLLLPEQAPLSIDEAQARTLIDNAAVVQLLGARSKLAVDITEDEIMRLGENGCVALIEGRELERMRRVRYFERPELSDLAGPDAGGLTQLVAHAIILWTMENSKLNVICPPHQHCDQGFIQ